MGVLFNNYKVYSMMTKKQLTSKQIDMLLELLKIDLKRIYIDIKKLIGRMCELNSLSLQTNYGHCKKWRIQGRARRCSV